MVSPAILAALPQRPAPLCGVRLCYALPVHVTPELQTQHEQNMPSQPSANTCIESDRRSNRTCPLRWPSHPTSHLLPLPPSHPLLPPPTTPNSSQMGPLRPASEQIARVVHLRFVSENHVPKSQIARRVPYVFSENHLPKSGIARGGRWEVGSGGR